MNDVRDDESMSRLLGGRTVPHVLSTLYGNLKLMIRTRNSETIQPILPNTEVVRARLESSTSKTFGPDRTIIVGVIVPSDGRTDPSQ